LLRGKTGYNGFKQDTFIAGKTLKCEAKPKNFDTEELEKYKRGRKFYGLYSCKIGER